VVDSQNETYAIKIFKGWVGLESFYNEVQTYDKIKGSIASPNIVKFKSSHDKETAICVDGSTIEVAVIVMEYVPGGSLRNLVYKTKTTQNESFI
jgi:serine/threonine protein kinase